MSYWNTGGFLKDVTKRFTISKLELVITLQLAMTKYYYIIQEGTTVGSYDVMSFWTNDFNLLLLKNNICYNDKTNKYMYAHTYTNILSKATKKIKL